jgi:hypothetical protein
MWRPGKKGLTDFGRFIEGCTEAHYPTNGFLHYAPYVQHYKKTLEAMLRQDKKNLVDAACLGDVDAFREIQRLVDGDSLIMGLNTQGGL